MPEEGFKCPKCGEGWAQCEGECPHANESALHRGLVTARED